MEQYCRILLFKQVIYTLIVTMGLSTTALAKDTKTPTAVYQKLSQVQSNLKRIAEHMGIESERCVNYQVKSAAPREVYFQAIQLKNKIDLLEAEVTGRYAPQNKIPTIENKQLSPNDVYQVINQANIKLNNILAQFNLEGVQLGEKKTATPSDVFKKLLLENQVATQLLEHKILPVDTYMTTTLSVYYAGRILSSMPGVDPITSTQATYQNKTPKDVFDKQIEIIHALKKIAASLKINMLSVQPVNCGLKITSDNTLDLSLIILSELTYIAYLKNIAIDNIHVYQPEKKYTSDVYQRNQLLLLQLNKILHYISTNPTWHKDK